MRISDWSSDVCSSDLFDDVDAARQFALGIAKHFAVLGGDDGRKLVEVSVDQFQELEHPACAARRGRGGPGGEGGGGGAHGGFRSEARRVGKACGSPFSSRWAPSPYKNKNKKKD